MIEHKLYVGRILHIPHWPPPTQPAAPGGFHTLAAANYHVARPTKHYSFSRRWEDRFVGVQATNAIVPGQGAPHRDFVWLPWIAGVITEVTTTEDVLTGPMSGCWVVVYQRNGHRCVGHVGTDNDQVSNAAVKQAWNTFAANNQNGLRGFNPSDAWPTFPAQLAADGGPHILGLVTSDDRLFSVLTWAQNVQPVGGPVVVRIAGVQEVASSSVQDLSNLT